MSLSPLVHPHIVLSLTIYRCVFPTKHGLWSPGSVSHSSLSAFCIAKSLGHGKGTQQTWLQWNIFLFEYGDLSFTILTCFETFPEISQGVVIITMCWRLSKNQKKKKSPQKTNKQNLCERPWSNSWEAASPQWSRLHILFKGSNKITYK